MPHTHIRTLTHALVPLSVVSERSQTKVELQVTVDPSPSTQSCSLERLIAQMPTYTPDSMSDISPTHSRQCMKTCVACRTAAPFTTLHCQVRRDSGPRVAGRWGGWARVARAEISTAWLLLVATRSVNPARQCEAVDGQRRQATPTGRQTEAYNKTIPKLYLYLKKTIHYKTRNNSTTSKNMTNPGVITCTTIRRWSKTNKRTHCRPVWNR